MPPRGRPSARLLVPEQVEVVVAAPQAGAVATPAKRVRKGMQEEMSAEKVVMSAGNRLGRLPPPKDDVG